MAAIPAGETESTQNFNPRWGADPTWGEYVVKQVVEFTWTVDAGSPLEAARMAMDEGTAHAATGIPNHRTTDVTVNRLPNHPKVWRYNSGDIL